MLRRSRAREVVLQLLFQWDQNANPMPRPAVEQFAHDRLLGDAELKAYCLALFDGVVAHKNEIDSLIVSTATNWRLSRMMPVDRNTLRLATYELLFDKETVPMEIVIDEAVQLARRFGSEESSAFVNGILDSIAKSRQTDAAEADDASGTTTSA